MRQLQEVPPQQCCLCVPRPLLLQALSGGRRGLYSNAALHTSPALSRPSLYLEQSLEQRLVPVEVGGVRGVQAWQEGRTGPVPKGPPAPPPREGRAGPPSPTPLGGQS